MTRWMIVATLALAAAGCAKKQDDGAAGKAAEELADKVEPAAKPTPAAKAGTLDDFMPAELGGVKRMKMDMPEGMGPTPPDAVAAYLSASDGRSININLMKVKDLGFSKGQFKGLAAGETREEPGARLQFKGFEVKGYKGERVRYLSESKKSEARLLLADKVDVLIAVQPTEDPDEAIRYVEQLDLAAIEAFAKTL